MNHGTCPCCLKLEDLAPKAMFTEKMIIILWISGVP